MKKGKSPKTHKTMAVVIPIGIIEEILSRLPTKSLLRFSSVSKEWFNLISDPRFIRSQLKHVLSDQYNGQQKLLISSSVSPQFHSVDYESVDCNVRQLNNLPFLAPHGVTALGSCNGLLCIGINDGQADHVEDISYNAIIWNPLFKNYKSVSSLVPMVDEFVSIGFGYDSLTDDYKLVILDRKHPKVDVYSMKASSWRSFRPEFQIVDEDFWASYAGIFFNGCIYWYALVQIEIDVLFSHSMLLEFDLKNEIFRFVKLPIGKLRVERLLVVKGCLTILFKNENYEYSRLLTMKEDNCNAISWSHEIDIRLPLMWWTICFKMNDEIVIQKLTSPLFEELESEKDRLIIYNPHDNKVTRSPRIVGLDSGDCTIYFETLVSPP